MAYRKTNIKTGRPLACPRPLPAVSIATQKMDMTEKELFAQHDLKPNHSRLFFVGLCKGMWFPSENKTQ